MGDPKRPVNTYSGPRHPWEAERIQDEKKILFDYGLKNKKDIWKQSSYVKNIKNHVKKINANVGKGIELEKEALIKKLIKYNLLNENQTLDDALELTIRDVMERRLQTILVRSGLARTMKQARQFIVHGHVMVDGKKITSPSYMVSKDEQFKIEFLAHSHLSDPEHPERKTPEVIEAEEFKKEEEAKKENIESVDDEVSKEISEKLDSDEDVTEEENKE